MQGSIAQAAALAIFGNDILRGYSRENFWPASTVFKFCKAVRFVALSGEATKPTESLFAEDPVQWISRLRGEGTTSLRLHDIPRNDPRISDRMSVGFVGGGGRWVIETRQAQASDLWEARWQVMNKDDPDQKIWGVTIHIPRLFRRTLSFGTNLHLRLAVEPGHRSSSGRLTILLRASNGWVFSIRRDQGIRSRALASTLAVVRASSSAGVDLRVNCAT